VESVRRGHETDKHVLAAVVVHRLVSAVPADDLAHDWFDGDDRAVLLRPARPTGGGSDRCPKRPHGLALPRFAVV
jgi:hypothetical protein